MASLLAHAKDLARKGVRGPLDGERRRRARGARWLLCLGCEAVVRGKLATLDHLGACEGAQRRLDDAMTAMPPTRANANANANANAAREREATLPEIRRARRVREERCAPRAGERAGAATRRRGWRA